MLNPRTPIAWVRYFFIEICLQQSRSVSGHGHQGLGHSFKLINKIVEVFNIEMEARSNITYYVSN